MGQYSILATYPSFKKKHTCKSIYSSLLLSQWQQLIDIHTKWHGWWLVTVGSREHPSLLGHCMGALTSPGLLPLPYSFLCFLLFTPSTVLQWLSFFESLQVCSPVGAAIGYSICDLKFATLATKWSYHIAAGKCVHITSWWAMQCLPRRCAFLFLPVRFT